MKKQKQKKHPRIILIIKRNRNAGAKTYGLEENRNLEHANIEKKCKKT